MACPYTDGKPDVSCHSTPEAGLNPATKMPFAAELQKSQTDDASAGLDAARETSSIPRTASASASSGGEKWLYPSPRMFYNALRRKGFDTRPEDVDVMVDVHNLLNESVWEEVLRWEAMHREECGQPTLTRFMGRPRDLSPKAWLYHRVYGGPRPFDRHDWTVDRCGQEVRYVIDYYSSGEPNAFNVDVRPALDSPQALLDRLRMSFSDWWGSGK